MQLLGFFGALFGLLATSASHATVRPPRLVSDGMVLQGDTSLRIWGWAAVREKVVMSIQGKTHSAAAAPRGEWQVLLPAQKASDPLER